MSPFPPQLPESGRSAIGQSRSIQAVSPNDCGGSIADPPPRAIIDTIGGSGPSAVRDALPPRERRAAQAGNGAYKVPITWRLSVGEIWNILPKLP